MALKVFNLQCATGHLFEGWFGSHDDYDAQQARGLVSCPMCQSADIKKMPSAPHINSSRTMARTDQPHARQGVVPQNPEMSVSENTVALQKLQSAVLSHLREVVGQAENVGAAFAREARAIHEGESEARPIRGTASEQEREALVQDGIAIMPLPDFLSDDRLQ